VRPLENFCKAKKKVDRQGAKTLTRALLNSQKGEKKHNLSKARGAVCAGGPLLLSWNKKKERDDRHGRMSKTKEKAPTTGRQGKKGG